MASDIPVRPSPCPRRRRSGRGPRRRRSGRAGGRGATAADVLRPCVEPSAGAGYRPDRGDVPVRNLLSGRTGGGCAPREQGVRADRCGTRPTRHDVRPDLFRMCPAGFGHVCRSARGVWPSHTGLRGCRKPWSAVSYTLPVGRPAWSGMHRWCTGSLCAPLSRLDGRIHAYRPAWGLPGRRCGRLPGRGCAERPWCAGDVPGPPTACSVFPAGGAPGVSAGRIITPDQGRVRGHSGHRCGAWGGDGRGVNDIPVSGTAADFLRTPGLRARRRGTRGGVDPAVASCARGALASGRSVTQKHRQSTLRSTSGGCLCVTHREDCGRVPSKRRCCDCASCQSWGGMRCDCVFSHRVSNGRGKRPAVRSRAGGVPRDRCAGGVAEGMGYVGLACRTMGLAAGPGPAAQPPRPSPHVLRASGPPRRPTDDG